MRERRRQTLLTPCKSTHTDINFKDIAPYSDEEVQAALQLLINDLSFMKVMRFVYPDLNEEEISQLCMEIHSVYEFQARISYPAMNLMVKKTISELTYEGLDSFVPGKGHLIISNHRDIILDSAILNIILFQNNLNTTETAIGSNLLSNPTVKHLTKLNKNFTVQRGGNIRETYDASHKLSSYIRKTIVEQNQSVWISQREGRAKDGNDRTQQGLLKMFTMSTESKLREGFEELDIRPLSISYEYDPCDTFKVRELMAKRGGEEYTKEENEDLRSIVAGISGKKGRVHFNIGSGIHHRLDALQTLSNKNEKFQLLASIIDQEIHKGLCLFPNNYYAADLIQGTKNRQGNYDADDITEFEEYLNGIVRHIKEDTAVARTILLQKYAWPVFNKEEALTS